MSKNLVRNVNLFKHGIFKIRKLDHFVAIFPRLLSKITQNLKRSFDFELMPQEYNTSTWTYQGTCHRSTSSSGTPCYATQTSIQVIIFFNSYCISSVNSSPLSKGGATLLGDKSKTCWDFLSLNLRYISCCWCPKIFLEPLRNIIVPCKKFSSLYVAL